MVPILKRINDKEAKDYFDKILQCRGKKEKTQQDFIKTSATLIKELLTQIGKTKLLREYQNEEDKDILQSWIRMDYESMKSLVETIKCKMALELRGIESELNKDNGVFQTYADIFKHSKKEDKKKNEQLKQGLAGKYPLYSLYLQFNIFVKVYEQFSENRVNFWIIQLTGLKVCPYCNISYTYNRGEDSVGGAVTAQLDHFYPKSVFPMFALCFYNLIPSCSACNHIKLDDLVEMTSPYSTDPFRTMKIKWQYDFDVEDATLADLEGSISLKVDSDDPGDLNNISKLKLQEAYEQHKDYAAEIVKKAKKYKNPSAQKLITNISDQLGLTSEEVMRYYFANYIDCKDFKERSLSKMTSDIFNDIVGNKDLEP